MEQVREKIGLSGTALKWIALVSMLIDHIGAAVFCVYTSFYDGSADFASADLIYKVLRFIGRTSFPIFAFLIVEGFFHTKNVKKYLLRLFLFALISEVPFDLAFQNKLFEFTKQNVFITLFLGLLTLCLVKLIMERPGWDFWMKTSLSTCVSIIMIWVAVLLKCDYNGFGVLLVLVFYVFHAYPVSAMVGGLICMSWEIECFPAFLLLLLYNGKKGKGMKYFFYIFYPLHLLVLYELRNLIV